MIGRRRRASTSSVETVDERQIRWRQEASVVRTLPKSSDKNSWPTFELRYAVVYDREGQNLASALDVATRGPYTIRGYLVIEDSTQRSHLIVRIRSPVPIEIRDCTEYSIGESEDSSVPLIWIAGQGGWYEISPSPTYLPIYIKMCEATTMYYRLIDACQSAAAKKPTSKKLSHANRLEALSNVFLRYTTSVGDGSTFEEVVERCAEHAVFFAAQFARAEYLIDWKGTEFYKWFIVEHADVIRQIEEATKNPRKAARAPSLDVASSPVSRDRASRQVTRSASIEVIDHAQFQSSQKATARGQSARKSEASPSVGGERVPTPVQPVEAPPTDPSATETTPFASVVAALEQIYDKVSSSKHGFTGGKALNELYFHYKFPGYKDGSVASHKIPPREVLHYNAAALLQGLDKKFQAHGVYALLQDLANKPFSPVALKPSDFPFRVVARKLMPRKEKKPETAQPFDAFDNSEVDTDEPPRPMGKTLKKPGRRPKKSSLRTVTASQKRTHAEMESGSDLESESSGLKRSHYFSDGDGDATMEDPVDPTPPGNAEATSPSLVKVVIRSEKIPSSVPKGPDDTWTCDQDGCDYIVRGGDAADCQSRIHRHFEAHAEQTRRLNLAVTESTRGHMPINHLLEKLKSMGETVQQKQQLIINGTPVPQPIKRKLIV